MRDLDHVTAELLRRGLDAAGRWQRDEARQGGDATAALEALAELNCGGWLELAGATTTTPPRPEDEPTASLGVVSEGTNETHELIPRLYSALEDLDEESALEWRVEYPYTAGWDSAGAAPDMMPPGDEPNDALVDLFHRLNHRAPIFAYFGVSREHGSGADYGFFPDFCGIDEAEAEGDLLKVEAGSVGQPGFIFEVNDHGNVTLYELTKREVWSCV